MLVFTHLVVVCAVDRQECVPSMLLAVFLASLASTVLDKQATRAGGMAAVVFRLLRAKLVE